MTTTFQKLGIDQLSAAERIQLALEIWESLGDERPDGQLSPEQKSELMIRDTELNTNPEIALTWEEIRARIEGGR